MRLARNGNTRFDEKYVIPYLSLKRRNNAGIKETLQRDLFIGTPRVASPLEHASIIENVGIRGLRSHIPRFRHTKTKNSLNCSTHTSACLPQRFQNPGFLQLLIQQGDNFHMHLNIPELQAKDGEPFSRRVSRVRNSNHSSAQSYQGSCKKTKS